MAIVLDPEFGAQLFALAERHPVWVVDSPTNRPIIEALWSQRRHEREPREVNVFRAIEGLSGADHVLALLRSIDAAHGPGAQYPPFATLIVDGVAADDGLTAALRARGATAIEPTGRGLRAFFRDTAHAPARSG